MACSPLRHRPPQFWRTSRSSFSFYGNTRQYMLRVLLFLTWVVAGPYGFAVQGKPFIRLRTETLDITPKFSIFSERAPSATPQYTYSAVPASTQGLPSAPASDAPTSKQVSPLWSRAANHSLYLMSFHSTAQRSTLFQLLGSFSTAAVASYIPDNTWVVVADAAAAAAAAAVQGIQVVEYLPQYKVAPEWSPILDLLQPSSPSSKRARTRRLLNEWAEGSPTGTPLDHLQLQQLPNLAPHAAIWVTFPPGQQGAGGGGAEPQPQPRKWRPRRRPAQMPGAAAADWAGPLRALLEGSGPGCQPQLTASVRGLQVSVCPADLQAAVAWLAAQPLAHFVAPVMRASTSNIYASIIAQVSGLPDDARTQPLHPVYTPFWRMGLLGEGQVVGIADTGLYLDSCFFFDPDNPLTAAALVKDNVTGVMVLRPGSHRKLAQYYAYANMVDENGHGTHVSGTVAGSPVFSGNASSDAKATGVDPMNAQGAAPAAKIAFFDMFDGTSLLPPPNLVDDLFQVQYNAGARVQSDSWGYAFTFAYTDSSSQVDLFTWRNLDFLPIFAVGNYAVNTSNSQYQSGIDAWGLRTAGTVTAPASSKNCLGVGAVNNYSPPAETTAPQLTFRSLDPASGALLHSLSAIATTSLDYGSHAALLGQVLNVTIAAPFQACGALTNSNAAVKGTLIITGRGGCTFSDKAISAAAAGAAAILVISNDTQRLQPGGNPTALTIPMAAVPLDAGSSILALLGITLPRFSSITTSTVLASPATGPTPLLSVEYEAVDDVSPVYESVPDFSGYGPTPDGRIKPDIVAPGASLLSALAPGSPSVGSLAQCSMVRQQGTSMSTPLVAGAAALAREYFQKGYYPSGAARKLDRYASPSGMLVKAVLVGGAAAVTGQSQLLLQAAPALAAAAGLAGSPLAQRFAGFGRLDLTHALPLQGNLYGPSWNLQIVDMVPIQEGNVHSYTITATGGVVIVTLVWFDYPADVNAQGAIVNDLDLLVVARVQPAPGEGNASAPSRAQDVTCCGNAQPCAGGVPDRVNTVERVVIENVMPNAVVNMSVVAHSIQSTFLDPSRQQRYALTVLGNIKGIISSPHNPARRQS